MFFKFASNQNNYSLERNQNIPVYSLDKFRKETHNAELYHIEKFNANRHFQVSYPHKHDFYEVLYISKGSGIHIIDENKYPVKPPCVFFLSPGQAHKIELSVDIKGYIFLFTAEFYLTNHQNRNKLLEYPFFFSVHQDNPPLYLNKKNDNIFIKGLFKRGSIIKKNTAEKNDEIARTILDLILLSCDRLYPSKLKNIQKGKGYTLVKNFLFLIEEKYQNNLSISNYAKLLNVTPNHLTQMVREITGHTSSELIQNRIIAEIKRLLIHSNLNITEISELMNFTDQSYFTKYFKKQTGTTPLQFRSKSMKNT